jgi:hypothetical protein
VERVWSQLAPRKQAGELGAVAVDMVRSRRELVLENAVLRHQVNVLRRGSKRRKLHLIDRLKLLTHDILFRQVSAFFIVHLGSRRVVHVAATRHPTQAWTAQQLRNATMDGDVPAVLLRDRDDKFGPAFDRVAQGVGAKMIRTEVRAPNMNSRSGTICLERTSRTARSRAAR